jgi:transglutaminase-like putative cysteine protease
MPQVSCPERSLHTGFTVRLDFNIELDYEVIQPSDFDFVIHAASTGRQRVLRERFEASAGGPVKIEFDSTINNQHARLRAQPGPLKIRYSALVDIAYHVAAPVRLQELPVTELPVDVLRYLRPSRYCPSDRLYQSAVEEFGKLAPGYARVLAISDWVRSRTLFKVGTTNSMHCAMDTYRDKVGVCRDFAHLMISICRALNIPARYVTSIDYGADPALGPMDFHAYVETYLSDRWYIFDPSGIALTTAAVRLATGRDAGDVAFATIFGSAQCSVPKVKMDAVEDPAAGITLPIPSDLAISTSGPADTLAAAPREKLSMQI